MKRGHSDCKCVGCMGGDQLSIEKQKINELGMAVIGVFDTEPPFAYSVGLIENGFPFELIVVGFPIELAGSILAYVRRKFMSTRKWDANILENAVPMNLPDGKAGYGSISLKEFSFEKVQKYCGRAFHHVKDPNILRVRQVFIPDGDGRTLDNPEYDQNLLDLQLSL